jgi:hypothetical protein
MACKRSWVRLPSAPFLLRGVFSASCCHRRLVKRQNPRPRKRRLTDSHGRRSNRYGSSCVQGNKRRTDLPGIYGPYRQAVYGVTEATFTISMVRKAPTILNSASIASSCRPNE